MVLYAFTPSTWEGEAGGSGTQACPWPFSELEASLGTGRLPELCLHFQAARTLSSWYFGTIFTSLLLALSSS